MSCPNWRDLSARRDAELSGAKPSSAQPSSAQPSSARTLDDERWQDALEHLDHCPLCRDEALAAEPTLLFRRLPALTADESQVREMQQAVAGMRRSAAALRRRRRLPGGWLRAAAVAAVLLGASLLHGTAPPSFEAGSPVAEIAAAGVPAAPVPAAVDGWPGELPEAEDGPAFEAAPLGVVPVAFETHASALPLVEMADPSFGSIIEVVDQDITVVVVTPQNRDV